MAFDHVLDKTWVIVNPGAREQELGFRRPEQGQWDGLYDAAVERIAHIADKMQKAAGADATAFDQKKRRQKILFWSEIFQESSDS